MVPRLLGRRPAVRRKPLNRRQGRQDLRKANTPSNIGGETRGDKTSGRRIHHETQGHMRGDKGIRPHLGKPSTPSTTGTHVQPWETMGGKGRQELGNADTPSNTGTPREREHTIQHRHTCGETMGGNESNGGHWQTMGDKGGQELAKADTPSNTGTHMQGDTGETRPREGEHTFQHRRTCATMGDKRRQDFGKADTPSNTGTHMWGDNGRQGEKRDKTLGRRTQHPIQAHMWGDEGRQGLGKADTPSNTGAHVPQWETMGDQGRQGETREDKTSGRRTHHPTQAHMWGDNGGQGETRGDKRQGQTRPREGGHTIQHRHTCGETMGDKWTQDLGEADTPSNTGTHVRDNGRQGETRGDKARQGETRPWEGGHTIQHRHTCGETMGDKWTQDLGEADTPSNTGTHVRDNGRQGETRGDKGRQGETTREGGRTIQHRHTCGETMGDKGRQGETRPWEGGHRIQRQGGHLKKAFHHSRPQAGGGFKK